MHRRAVSKLAGVWAAVAGGGGVQEEEGLAGGGGGTPVHLCFLPSPRRALAIWKVLPHSCLLRDSMADALLRIFAIPPSLPDKL